jgi:hypothetical protein
MNVQLVAATTSITTNTSSDYSLTLANASSTVNARKLYALVWIGR